MNKENKDFVRNYINPSGFEALRMGHPWLRQSDLKKDFPLPRTPCLFPLGEHWFLCAPQSKIPLRRLGPSTPFWPDTSSVSSAKRSLLFDPRDFSVLFGKPLQTLLEQRYLLKKSLMAPDNCFRWIFSENDLIPGLIVDIYDQTAVAQVQSEALELFWSPIETAFNQLKGQCFQELYRSQPAHGKETSLYHPDKSNRDRQILSWNGLQWKMQPGGHQKTGAYLDQKNNHLKAVRWASALKIPTAWDLFCFEGGFGLHLAHSGMEVLGVDQSLDAIRIALENRDLNQISDKNYNAHTQDVFEFLQTQIKKQQKTKMIVLDPPAFARSASHRQAALKGLYELHSLALKCLESDSLLVSCSCSHAITRQDILKVLGEVSHRYRRSFHVLEISGASADHGWVLPFAQGEYLQCWFISVGKETFYQT